MKSSCKPKRKPIGWLRPLVLLKTTSRSSTLYTGLSNDLQTDCDRIAQEIEDKRQRQATFNITLYGRTMSGKSTLMEILTKGDGKSIGNGAQRATRDVRTYKWQGLAVTDVPGIAAFGGDEDEKTALEAARQSDLVLFLITDDAPQPAEAEHLARLRRMGLPLLGICNVKENLSKRPLHPALHPRPPQVLQPHAA